VKKSEIINKLIIQAGLADSVIDANRIFVQAFVDHYLDWNLARWDTDVTDATAHSYLHDLGSANGMTPKFLIKDLDTYLKKHRE